jgi:uncharacterized cupin superfamily protein
MTNGKPTKPVLIRAADRARIAEESWRHPLNAERAEVRGVSLSEAVGLERIGVHLLKVPPGKESMIAHRHYREEEWCFILAGRGVLEVDGQPFEIGAGDFMGFPVPSVAHTLRNPHDEDLVYLTCGERLAFEIADYPTIGKRMVRNGQDVRVYPLDAGEPMKDGG